MHVSKEIADKVERYQALKSEMDNLRLEIKNCLENEVLGKAGSTLGVGTFEPFITDHPSGELGEDGIYDDEKIVGRQKHGKYWYSGRSFIPVEGSGRFLGYEYER